MEINTNNPVGNQIQGLETTPKVSEVKREKEEAPDRQAAQAQESPDYRISLSDASKKAAELTGPASPDPSVGQVDLTEEQAALVARQTSAQLAQTHAAISNQAIAKALDLFT